ncbi:hypothetical protein A7D00_0900 [Trichophyton violaceum]|uniref:Uncharacterized protein n=1 Tax=Trichophyton violaceum TaxID=34388 RepID=A0A178FS97_TRIVO|nr:hypothetical protein A7D00_0900 [Trichophyton violaceum]
MVRGKILKALSRMENFLIEKPSQAWKSEVGLGRGAQEGWKDSSPYQTPAQFNATDKTLREAAQKISHRVWATADIEVNPDITKEEAPAVNIAMFRQLKDNLDE